MQTQAVRSAPERAKMIRSASRRRAGRADAEQVVDEAARPGAADGAADAGVPDPPGHVGDGEEVGGHPGPCDDVELVLQAVTGLLRGLQEADAARAAAGARGRVPAVQEGGPAPAARA